MGRAMHQQTGFSDVDSSGRSEALVDYLGALAQHVGEVRLARSPT